MFFKKKPQARNIKMPANLNRKQQREIKAVVERAKKDNGIPQTAQQSIPFQRMFPDGICRVTDSYYTKTIQFQDINYQLAQQDNRFHAAVIEQAGLKKLAELWKSTNIHNLAIFYAGRNNVAVLVLYGIYFISL